MADLQNKVAIGAILHDIGKVLYRAADGRNHSRSGYDFLKEEVGITDPEILNQVLYHHAALLKCSDLPSDSPAYITYMADNIAAAADRRTKNTDDSGYDRNAALESIFNVLNGNRGNMHYTQGTLEDDGTIRTPISGPVQYNENFYVGIRQHLKEVLAALTDEKNIQESYINSLLSAMEADLSYVPSSTDKGQLGDVSLYDHVKITAAIASCIYAWTVEQEITDYKGLLFDKAADFYEICRQHRYSDFKAIVKDILEVEAPLSEDLFLKRIVWYFDREKVTSVVQRAYEQQMYGYQRYGIIRRNGFLYLDNGKEVQFRGPGDIERDIKQIAPEELAAGMLEILKQNVTADKAGLYRSLAAQCGVARVGKAVNEAMDTALHILEDRIIVDGEQISLK